MCMLICGLVITASVPFMGNGMTQKSETNETLQIFDILVLNVFCRHEARLHYGSIFSLLSFSELLSEGRMWRELAHSFALLHSRCARAFCRATYIHQSSRYVNRHTVWLLAYEENDLYALLAKESLSL